MQLCGPSTASGLEREQGRQHQLPEASTTSGSDREQVREEGSERKHGRVGRRGCMAGKELPLPMGAKRSKAGRERATGI